MKQVTIDNVRERMNEIEMWRGANNLSVSLKEEFELACLRQLLAAMDSEPVAWRWNYGGTTIWRLLDTKPGPGSNPRCPRVIEPLYRHAQPAPERDQVRAEHAEWSQATFGGVGPIGPLKHLSIEALEAAEAPGDLSEWADLQFLMWDAQRRAGITDEQITQAMIDKLAVNKARTWPEPKDGEPRLHVKEQPAPVVPDALVTAAQKLLDRYLSNAGTDYEFIACWTPGRSSIGTGGVWDEWKALEAALNGQPAEPATDNTAQQFEALATSAQPEIIGYESRVICGEPRRVPKFAGQDIEATRAASGEQPDSELEKAKRCLPYHLDDRYKVNGSWIGSVQNYIATLEQKLEENGIDIDGDDDE